MSGAWPQARRNGAQTRTTVSLAREARHWLRAHRHGLLSTHSLAVDGYPFGSVIPYIMDHHAHPVMLISSLAEHTKNMAEDSRVSLLVHAGDADMQAAARVTLIGRARRVENPASIESRYQRYFPASRGYRDELDFEYWRIMPVTLRVIAGFAKAHWVSREAYAPPLHQLSEAESGIIARMNTDHIDTLRLYCLLHQIPVAAHVEMIGVDCDGFDMRSDELILRFNFEGVVTDEQQAHNAMSALAEQAKKVSRQ
jgi:heme iron utilization protein